MDATTTADLFVEFGREHKADIMRGGSRIIDDLDEALDYVLSDDTGMNGWDNRPLGDFPVELRIDNVTFDDIAAKLADTLEQNGFELFDEPVEDTLGNVRIAQHVSLQPYKYQYRSGVNIKIQDVPPLLNAQPDETSDFDEAALDIDSSGLVPG